MQKNVTSENDSRLMLAMIAIIIFSVILALPFTTIADKPDPDNKLLSNTINTFGNYGSWAGGIIGAFAGLITIYFVKKTFQQQVEALKVAQNTNEKQQFDGMLSLLLQEHNSVLQEVSKVISDDKFDLLNKEHHPVKNDYYLEDEVFRFHTVINRYMRVLYQVLKHIDQWDLKNNKEKISIELSPTQEAKQYCSLIRSFINSDILSLVALNSLQRNKDGKLLYPEYKTMLEKYAFLEHLVFPNDINQTNQTQLDIVNAELLTNKMFIITSFREEAFGDNCNKANYLNKLCDCWNSIEKATIMNCTNKRLTIIERFNQFQEKIDNFLNKFYDEKAELYYLQSCFVTSSGDKTNDYLLTSLIENHFLHWVSQVNYPFKKYTDSVILDLKRKMCKELFDIANLDMDFSSHIAVREKLEIQLSNSKNSILEELSSKLANCAKHNYRQHIEIMIDEFFSQSDLPTILESQNFIRLDDVKNEYIATSAGQAWVNKEKMRQS